MADTTTQPFVWGPGGEAMTVGDLARRKVADALVAQGTTADPLPAGTRGAGVWTQGLARVAKALMGGVEERDIDNSEKAQNANTTALLESNPMLQSAPAASPAAMPVAADTTAPRGIRNNNPLNIEAGAFTQSQPGYAGSDGRFAKFQSPDQGVAAANSLLDTYQSKYGLNTVNGIVNRWAPASDGNDINAYAADVAQRMGVDPNAPLTVAQRPALIASMGQHENGQPIQMPGAPAAAAPVAGTGLARVGTALANGTAAAQAAAPAAPTQAASPIPLQAQSYIKSLLADPQTRAAGVQLLGQYAARQPKETYSQQTDADGNVWNVNNQTGQRTVALQATKDPTDIKNFEYGQAHPEFVQRQNELKKLAATNVNVDTGVAPTFGRQLAQGAVKPFVALSNGVEDAQARARSYAQMQGAIDAIQKGGGTTGGLAPEQRLTLMKTANAAAATLGMNAPFDENAISDKEMLAKSGRQLAGEMAKNAVGSRVTNFEMNNFLQANPGLAMSATGNQRLIGIGSQIANRDVAVGQAIRRATTQAISRHQDPDPATLQKIIDDYDQAHHISDPVTGQDLTGSYVLPEFQTQGNNAALAVGHTANINGIQIRRVN